MRSLSPKGLLRGHKDFSNFCALSFPPVLALSTSDDCTVRLWDIQNPEKGSATLEKLPDSGWKCALSENGLVAAAACNDGIVRVWCTRDGKKICSTRRRGFDTAFGTALSAAGDVLVASFFSSATSAGALVRFAVGESRLVELASWSAPLSWNHGAVCVSRAADVVALAAADGLHVFDGVRGTLLFAAPVSSKDFDVTLSASGRRAAVADRYRFRIYYQSAFALWRVRTFDGYNSPLAPCCAISGDGRTAVAAQGDATFRVWAVNQRTPIFTLKGHTGVTRGCAISFDGALVLTGSTDSTLRLWGLYDEQEAILEDNVTILEVENENPAASKAHDAESLNTSDSNRQSTLEENQHNMGHESLKPSSIKHHAHFSTNSSDRENLRREHSPTNSTLSGTPRQRRSLSENDVTARSHLRDNIVNHRTGYRLDSAPRSRRSKVYRRSDAVPVRGSRLLNALGIMTRSLFRS